MSEACRVDNVVAAAEGDSAVTAFVEVVMSNSCTDVTDVHSTGEVLGKGEVVEIVVLDNVVSGDETEVSTGT